MKKLTYDELMCRIKDYLELLPCDELVEVHNDIQYSLLGDSVNPLQCLYSCEVDGDPMFIEVGCER